MCVVLCCRIIRANTTAVLTRPDMGAEAGKQRSRPRTSSREHAGGVSPRGLPGSVSSFNGVPEDHFDELSLSLEGDVSLSIPSIALLGS